MPLGVHGSPPHDLAVFQLGLEGIGMLKGRVNVEVGDDPGASLPPGGQDISACS